ncbi:lysylphosphatidylglycerol synthase domain-containing protein [Gephyromycinifex aptenodytis]|uniref:lysylphosphatidylglycerol synthase domain-containing protein n=1 Tax=Gephyromycinifex aptenodytis TaxID=2716227 RepID=UPI0014474F88|nr:lysylphosphatidylglycerol synthase domain-containing protein [Gephyromycinifex aptenodytis]
MNSRAVISGIAQSLAVALLFALLWRRFGSVDLGVAARVLNPVTILASLALGAGGATVAGLRWRVVAAGLGDTMSVRSAVLRCYEAAFLNAVLPGGLAGDALRAVRRGRAGQPWQSSLGSVLGERLCGTAVVVGAAAATLFRFTPGGALPWIVAGIAVLALAAAIPSLRRLSGQAVASVLALSVLGWAIYLTMFLLAASSTGLLGPGQTAFQVGCVALGGMSVPINLGGWGPREGAAAYAAEMAGVGGATGLGVSIAYGLLALVSVLPGVCGLFVSGRQHDLGADVIAEHQAP